MWSRQSSFARYLESRAPTEYCKSTSSIWSVRCELCMEVRTFTDQFDDVRVDLNPFLFLKALLAEMAFKASGFVFTLWYHSPEEVSEQG